MTLSLEPAAETDIEHAPIVPRLSKRNDLAPVISYLDRVRQDNVATARTESLRLASYFDLFATRLRKDLANKGTFAPDLTDPDKLSSFFTGVAARYRNTMLSEVIVLPRNTYAVADFRNAVFGPEHYTVGGMPEKSFPFVFDFTQVFGNDHRGDIRSSVSLPVFALDKDKLDAISDHEPERLLGALQGMMSLINHDSLHHYANITLNSQFARTFFPAKTTYKDYFDMPLIRWSKKYFNDKNDSDPLCYENFSMLCQARILGEAIRNERGQALPENLETYFDELKRISGKLAQTDAGKAHETADYFNTLMGLVLMRFLPVDHAVMIAAYERMQDADPLPDRLPAEAMNGLIAAQKERRSPGVTEELKNLRKKIGDVLASYEDSTFSIVPAAGAASYAQKKILTLIESETSFARLHSRRPQGEVRRSWLSVFSRKSEPLMDSGTLLDRTADIAVDMMKAVAETIASPMPG